MPGSQLLGKMAANYTSGYIDYIYIYEHNNHFLASLLFIAIMLLLFLALSTLADTLIGPNLSTIAYIFNIPESVCGVTIAAFANGVGDIAGSLVSFDSALVPLSLGEMIGAALFVTSISVGIISIRFPDKLPSKIITRDLIFFIGALLLFGIVIIDGQIKIWDSLSLIFYYLFYVFIVIYNSYTAMHAQPAQTAVLDRQSSICF